MTALDPRAPLDATPRHLAAAPGPDTRTPPGDLLDLDPRDLSDERLGVHVVALELLIRRAQAAQARAVRVFDLRDAAGALGFPATRSWLTAHLTTTDREARSLLGLGRAMDRFPALARAFATGAATAAHLRIASAASRFLTDATVAGGDPLLAATARTLDPRRFGTVVDRWVKRVAPAEFERDTQKKYDSRWLSIGETFGGMHSIQGMLDPEAGSLLAGTLAALVRANPAGDTRTGDQQRADALTDLTRAALASTGLGVPAPEVVVHTTPDTLLATPGAPPAERLGAGPLTQRGFDRLACGDARWRRLLTDPAGVPTELGRATRDVPPGLRKLVALRDGGCRYPGCTRTPNTCEAHHVVHWRHGGTTDRDNLVLLCTYHHHLVHDRDHHLRLHPGARVTVTRPDGTTLTSRPHPPPYALRL